MKNYFKNPLDFFEPSTDNNYNSNETMKGLKMYTPTFLNETLDNLANISLELPEEKAARIEEMQAIIDDWMDREVLYHTWAE